MELTDVPLLDEESGGGGGRSRIIKIVIEDIYGDSKTTTSPLGKVSGKVVLGVFQGRQK